MKVMLTYFHELVSPHSVSFVAYLSFCLYSRRNIAPRYYERTVAELKFRDYCQCHDINSKTTFTLITLFFTLVMFLSFCHSKIVICGIITDRQHIKAMI
jgi:hypothetical protein